jgi:hypothetical protein
MTDLVKRLRDEKMGCNLWCEYYDGITTIPLCIEAADRIEKLTAALRSIAANACCDSCREAALVARKALEGKDD